MTAAYTILARSRGLTPGSGSRCACCGDSPFDAGERTSRRLSDSFSDHGLLADPAAPEVCAGCVSLLAGRPGDDPPPARMLSILAIDGCDVEYPDRAGVWAALLDPPDAPHVLVFAASRKKHAWLRAGVSSRDLVLVGTDDGTVAYRPAIDRPAVNAALRLLGGFRRDAVASGVYPSSQVAAYGVADHSRDEAAVSPIRGPLLSLVCALAPKQPPRKRSHSDMPLFAHPGCDDVISPHDTEAAQLLAHIAQTCRMRGADGKRFWSGFYRHRVERFRRLPLPDLVSRLSDAIGASPTAPGLQAALGMLASLDADHQAEIERSIRERPALCVALSFDLIDRGAFR